MGWQVRRTYLFISFTCYQASFLGLQSHEQTISQSPHCFTFFFFSMTISGSCPCQCFFMASRFLYLFANLAMYPISLLTMSFHFRRHIFGPSLGIWIIISKKKVPFIQQLLTSRFFYWVCVNFLALGCHSNSFSLFSMVLLEVPLIPFFSPWNVCSLSCCVVSLPFRYFRSFCFF